MKNKRRKAAAGRKRKEGAGCNQQNAARRIFDDEGVVVRENHCSS